MLKHKYKISAVVICLIFFFLALFSSAGFYPVKFLLDKTGFAGFNKANWNNLKYGGNGILADEIPHISAGYYYLNTGRYFINPEHPPLVKDIAGLGELAVHQALPEITPETSLPENYQRPEYPFGEDAKFPKALEQQNNQDHFGVMYLFHPGNNPDVIAFWARLSVIFFNTLLLFALFTFLKKLWSQRAALLGLFFFAVSQFSLAHGSFVVIDFMSSLLIVLAIITFALYLKKYAEEEKTAKYFWLTSLFFALALLSKFSSVVLLPTAFLGGLIYAFFLENRSAFKIRASIILKYIFAFFAIMVVTLLFVSIFYAFHVFRMEDGALVKQLHDTYPYEQLPAVGTKILDFMVYNNVFTKGLAEYANGVFMVLSRMIVSAQNTYFLGHVYGNEGAGIWYFPVLYLAKLSPGFHFFSLAALMFIVAGWLFGKEKMKNRFQNFIANPLSFLLLVFVALYMFVTLRSTFQIGLRHIMPVILTAAVLIGKGTDLFWDKPLGIYLGKLTKFSLKLKHLFLVIAAAMLLSVFCSFPYYLEYYNIFVGGTNEGYKIATDSNYDWGGSDVRRLAEWVRERDIRNVYTQIFADVPLKYYLGDDQKYFNLQDEGKLPPEGSYLAVSIFEYMNNIASRDIPPEHKYTILKDQLVGRAGKTILIYRIP